MDNRMQRAAQGWEISDVERLIGLPRRHIQRACYTGKDGVGILAPETNGRNRVYGIHDLAALLAVSLLRDERYSRDHQRHTLGEVRDAIVDAGWDIERILQSETELLRDQLEEMSSQYLKVRALVAALDSNTPEESLASLIREVEAVGSALGPDAQAALLELPGFVLALELHRAFEDAGRNEGRDDRPKEKGDAAAKESL